MSTLCTSKKHMLTDTLINVYNVTNRRIYAFPLRVTGVNAELCMKLQYINIGNSHLECF